jgi:hypothetical protein
VEKGPGLDPNLREINLEHILTACIFIIHFNIIFLLRIRGVPGLNIGLETGYHDCGFVVFLRPSIEMSGHKSDYTASNGMTISER